MKGVFWLSRLLAVLCFFGICLEASAQQITINGYVTDASSGEQLIGAAVYDSKSKTGITTNVYGFYSLTLPEDTVVLRIAYLGYSSQTISLLPTKDTTLNIALKESEEQLEAVEIVADRQIKITERSEMSTINLDINQIETLPVFLGETDILKTLQLLPGVQSGGEGTSGLYVRGGGPDQNLILLDGVPVYNASHLFGFFSVFNSDAISNVQLIKGGFPARYGGRLSSVLDIRMKEGNMKEIHGEGSIGLVAAKLTLEGPIVKDKTSFIVSGRRTYIDVLAAPFIASVSGESGEDLSIGYYFYDVNAKVNHKFSDRDRLFLSAYLGDDVAFARTSGSYQELDGTTDFKFDAGLNWGNITTALRWNRVLNKKLFSNTTLTFSRYRFLVGQDFELETTGSDASDFNYSYQYDSGIRDFALKADFDYLPNPRHYIRFGAGDIYHTFNPGVTAYETEAGNTFSLDTTIGDRGIFAHELSAYIEDDMSINEKLKVNAGLHLSGFLVNEASYFSLQPRIAGNYAFADNWSAKASFATMTQFIHLLSNSSIGLPTDLWLPSTDRVKPQQSIQAAIGVARDINNGAYELSLEGYYKTMDNLIEYQDGATYLGDNDGWEDKIEVGRGWSYGAELFVQKKKGKLTGWVGYTLSWSERNFENLNFGRTFPYRYDRRHDIGLALTYNKSEKMDIGMVWVYGTGNALSLATVTYATHQPDQNISFFVDEINHVEDRNGYRMAAYHRLDLSVNFHKKKKWGQRTWSLGVYNLYDRRNPFFLYIGSDNNRRALKQVSLFPIIPSITYSFKF